MWSDGVPTTSRAPPNRDTRLWAVIAAVARLGRMTRIPPTAPAELDDEQRSLYESITQGPRAQNLFGVIDADRALAGPFMAMLLRPRIGDPVQRLGAAIRHGGALSDREREMAILMVAASVHCGYEQFAHEHVATRIGLTEDDLAAIRAGKLPALGDPHETAIGTTTRLLLDNGTLTDDEYAEAVATISTAELFELATLVGFYQLLALQIRVFGVEPPR
jgi:4-carboxymuconolactone decarboxylase